MQPRRKITNKALRQIINACNKEWQAVAVKAAALLFDELKRGHSLPQAMQAIRETYPALFDLPMLENALAKAAITSARLDNIAAYKYSLGDTWNGRKLIKLSRIIRSYDKEIRAGIVNTISKQLKANETAVNAARALYDGYNAGQVMPARSFAKYMQIVAAFCGETDDNAKYIFDRARRNIARLSKNGAPNQALKAAYKNLLEIAEKGAEKHLQDAIETAIHEKARYCAERIIRTESARAWADGFYSRTIDDADIVAYKWEMSGRHPQADICDMYANSDMYGLGKGVFPKNACPLLPAHPHCLCSLVEIYKTEININDAKDNTTKGGNAYLNSLTHKERAEILGVANADIYERGGRSWKQYARNFEGFFDARDRLRDIRIK